MNVNFAESQPLTKVHIDVAGQSNGFKPSNSKTHSDFFEFNNQKFNDTINIQYDVKRPKLNGGDIIIRV